MMNKNEMLMCLIAFILGYLVSRMIRGNGFTVKSVVKCDPTASPPELCPGGKACPQCGQSSCDCPPVCKDLNKGKCTAPCNWYNGSCIDCTLRSKVLKVDGDHVIQYNLINALSLVLSPHMNVK